MQNDEFKIEIPEQFYSDAEGKPFENCQVCGKFLARACIFHSAVKSVSDKLWESGRNAPLKFGLGQFDLICNQSDGIINNLFHCQRFDVGFTFPRKIKKVFNDSL